MWPGGRGEGLPRARLGLRQSRSGRGTVGKQWALRAAAAAVGWTDPAVLGLRGRDTCIPNNPGDRRGDPGIVVSLATAGPPASVWSECGRSFLPPTLAAVCPGVKEPAPLRPETLPMSIGLRGSLPSGPGSRGGACLNTPLVASVGPQTVAALLENCTLGTVRRFVFTPLLSLA